jgi:hypothetical protein
VAGATLNHVYRWSQVRRLFRVRTNLLVFVQVRSGMCITRHVPHARMERYHMLCLAFVDGLA